MQRNARKLTLAAWPVLIAVIAIVVVLLLSITEVRSWLQDLLMPLMESLKKEKLTDVWNSINGTITLMALIIGAGIGLSRFVRRRELRASCDLNLSVEMIDIANKHAIKVDATILNSGHRALLFHHSKTQVISIYSADIYMWEEACTHGREIMWEFDPRVEAFKFLTNESTEFSDMDPRKRRGRIDENILEPNQRYNLSWVFPIDADIVAIRVKLNVEADIKGILGKQKHSPWGTQCILVPKK